MGIFSWRRSKSGSPPIYYSQLGYYAPSSMSGGGRGHGGSVMMQHGTGPDVNSPLWAMSECKGRFMYAVLILLSICTVICVILSSSAIEIARGLRSYVVRELEPSIKASLYQSFGVHNETSSGQSNHSASSSSPESLSIMSAIGLVASSSTERPSLLMGSAKDNGTINARYSIQHSNGSAWQTGDVIADTAAIDITMTALHQGTMKGNRQMEMSTVGGKLGKRKGGRNLQNLTTKAKKKAKHLLTTRKPPSNRRRKKQKLSVS